MTRDKRSFAWGLILILGGTFWLFHSMGLIRGVFSTLFASTVLYLLAAFFGLLAYGDLERRAGLLLPAGILAAAGTMVLLDSLHWRTGSLAPLVMMSGIALPLALIGHLRGKTWLFIAAWMIEMGGVAGFLGEVGGRCDRLAPTVFLWGAALPFLWLFLRRGKEWQLLVGGILLSLGSLAGLENLRVRESLRVGLFFLSLSATFALVHLLGRPGHARWSRFAAIGTGLFGVVALFAGVARPVLTYGIPIGLIALGAYIVLGARGNGEMGGSPPSSPPPPPPSDPAGTAGAFSGGSA